MKGLIFMNKDYGFNNTPADYETLSGEEKEQCGLWIHSRLAAVNCRPCNRLNSYGLKHHMERETGLYVTNGQFKGAMEKAGYEAFDTQDINWTYKVKLIGKGLYGH